MSALPEQNWFRHASLDCRCDAAASHAESTVKLGEFFVQLSVCQTESEHLPPARPVVGSRANLELGRQDLLVKDLQQLVGRNMGLATGAFQVEVAAEGATLCSTAGQTPSLRSN